MSAPLSIVLTRVGLAAVVTARGNGLQASIDRMAVGLGVNAAGKYLGYVPTKAATALVNETIRVPILASSRLDPHGFRVLAQVPAASAPAEYGIREVGFFLATGELFAVWSDPALLVASKTTLAGVDLSFDLLLDQIPADALTVTVLAPDIPDTTAVLAELLAVAARTFVADLAQEKRMVARGIY